MSYTPGPWYVRTDGSIGSVQRGGMVVAHPVIEPKNQGDQADNARLIAAAPDLLAALEAAFKLQDGAYGIGISNGYWPTIAPIHEQIRAAIKKARGE